jgi:hypothetical protein
MSNLTPAPTSDEDMNATAIVKLVAFLAFCYRLERMTFPVLMSFAKTLFYSECNIRDMVG